jgi:4a-hydroxytetrahydrobiopterin dehydratase
VADIARREDHHPEMEVSYKICKVHYSTHAVEGLTENDFICAAKINELTKT